MVEMSEKINLIDDLVDRLIERNKILSYRNNEFKNKIKELEEKVFDLESKSENKKSILPDSSQLKAEIDAQLTELDKCINMTQKIIDNQK
jgi:predicted RNase H-like nuclease (RuvC/YqgF family)